MADNDLLIGDEQVCDEQASSMKPILEDIVASLDEKAMHEPIRLPGSPFWAVLKTFGPDMMLSMLFNAIGTEVASIAKPYFPSGLREPALLLSGPVAEKFAFFPLHIRKQKKIYNELPEKYRTPKKWKQLRKIGIKEGLKFMAEDACVQDLIYLGLMYPALTLAPKVPPFIFSALSSSLATLGVTALEVSREELAYTHKKHQLKKHRFIHDHYYESRFYVSCEKDPVELIEHFMKEFNLPSAEHVKYHDKYFDNILPEYSERKPVMRIRKRQRRLEDRLYVPAGEDPEWMQSAQIIYARATEDKKEPKDTKYYPIVKDMFAFPLIQPMPESLEQIEDLRMRNLLLSVQGNDKSYVGVNFERAVSLDHHGIFIAVDRMAIPQSVYFVDIKSHDPKLLRQGIRYALLEWPLLHPEAPLMQTIKDNSKIFRKTCAS